MPLRLASLAQGKRIHCTAAVTAALLLAGRGAAAQTAPAPGEASFGIFVRNTQIGREQVTLSRTDSGWVITSTGNAGAPIDFGVNRFEVKYAPDWQPLEMKLEAHTSTSTATITTSFGVTSAVNEITQGARTAAKTDQVSARTIVLPNNVFGACEALAARLYDLSAGAELPLYIVPQGEVKAVVRGIADQTLAGPGASLATRRFDLRVQNPRGPLDAVVVVDSRRRLVRYEIPAGGLLIVRDDAASVAMRTQPARNATDADVTIPANGFQLAGTLTTPAAVAGRLRYPAVILVGGVLPPDRDEVVDGIPIFTQLAAALAERGHVVLRYDRRGSGQSGGRTESATLAEYSDDVVSAVKWIARRRDVDRRRIVVAGYSDGGAVALLAAGREKGIDAVVTIDASGTLGADLLLLQQGRVLDDLKLSPADRQARIDLQKKIQAAVVSGRGWEGIPDVLRRQADTPWFRSVLTYDPAQVLPKTRQPILILHAERDASVPPTEADRLAEIARTRRKAGPVEVLRVPGVDHTLADPGTHAVSPAVATAIADWMHKQ